MLIMDYYVNERIITMPRSMTGYGRAVKVFDDREITVELKAVNHRFFEFFARTPRQYGFLEERLKKLFSSEINRGKVEAYVSIVAIGEPTETVEANAEVIESYVNALREIKERVGVIDDLSLSHLLRIPDAFTVRKVEEDEEALWCEVKETAEEALAGFVAMRETEGDKLKSDILIKLDEIEQNVHKVQQRSPSVTEQYRERLLSKLREVLVDKNIDEQRVLTEAAVFADKTAVDEEIVRLKSHISQYREILSQSEPIGKRLDFLIQEFNREVNTIGSKCNDLYITKIVLEMKNAVEKIREQIQNIE